MSVMETGAAFSASGIREIKFNSTGIQELSLDEIEMVQGAAWPAFVLACYASTACKVATLAVVGAVSAAVGYENNRE